MSSGNNYFPHYASSVSANLPKNRGGARDAKPQPRRAACAFCHIAFASGEDSHEHGGEVYVNPARLPRITPN